MGVTRWRVWWPVWHFFSLQYSLPHIGRHMLLPAFFLMQKINMVFRGEHAWAVLAAGIAGYELICDDEELLSVAVDRWLISHPLITRTAIAAVSLHLLNLLPWWIDILSKKLWGKMFQPIKSRKVNVVS